MHSLKYSCSEKTRPQLVFCVVASTGTQCIPNQLKLQRRKEVHGTTQLQGIPSFTTALPSNLYIAAVLSFTNGYERLSISFVSTFSTLKIHYRFHVLPSLLAASAFALNGPWGEQDHFGDIACEKSGNSPFTSDCENAANALEIHGGEVTNRLGASCVPQVTYHTCLIAICNGPEGRPIDAGEVAFRARAINTQCAQNVGNNGLDVSGGQIGVRNSNVGNVDIQIYNTGHNKRDITPTVQGRSIEDRSYTGSPTSRAGVTARLAHPFASRSLGQTFNVANTGFVLTSVDEAGDPQCTLADEEAGIVDSIGSATTNPNAGRRVARGGIRLDTAIDVTIAISAGTDGSYISDIEPAEWRQIIGGMLDFRAQIGSRATFTVQLASAGFILGRINLAARF
ncbi:hypothetical protein EJ04DRAFT_530022 [Polyplosphaeria fusca]|uniref:Uncharacterized protein n=1 Tax=Polyplosphaeria fusca TaxID=682080 RepID=A0A9P4UVG0_9PLEO|nr:hypothetical protein EJ04DRAFT_530022 [Polyplosphaeria fusca]